jgi:hypothetical protein
MRPHARQVSARDVSKSKMVVSMNCPHCGQINPAGRCGGTGPPALTPFIIASFLFYTLFGFILHLSICYLHIVGRKMKQVR